MEIIKRKFRLFTIPKRVKFEKLETGVVIETHVFKNRTKIIVRC